MLQHKTNIAYCGDYYGARWLECGGLEALVVELEVVGVVTVDGGGLVVAVVVVVRGGGGWWRLCGAAWLSVGVALVES